MLTDEQLLRAYSEGHSEAAFTELVGRHVDLVHSTALRTVRQPEMAQDVAQAVFLHLARKAGSIRKASALPGWLYRVACDQAANAVRAERRRRRREQEAVQMNSTTGEKAPAWGEIALLLDEAMRALARRDQDAVVLRFFQGQSLRRVGEALELSEDAAQKRLSRALERLRDYFARRGVKVSAAALASGLAAHAVEAAPSSLAANLAAASMSAASAGSAGSTLFCRIMLMTKTKTALISVALVAAVTPVALLQHQERLTRRENARLLQRQSELTASNVALGEEVSRLASQAKALEQTNTVLREQAAMLQRQNRALDAQAQSSFGHVNTPGQPESEPVVVGLREENLQQLRFDAINESSN
jgi:RNA polymerase sigma factor (sigma-70 family)